MKKRNGRTSKTISMLLTSAFCIQMALPAVTLVRAENFEDSVLEDLQAMTSSEVSSDASAEVGSDASAEVGSDATEETATTEEAESEADAIDGSSETITLPDKPTPATIPSGSTNLISPSTFDEAGISDTIFTWGVGWHPTNFVREIVTVEDSKGVENEVLKIDRTTISNNASGVPSAGNVDFYVEGLEVGKTYVLTCNAYTTNTGAAVRIGDGKNANLRTAQTLTKDAWTEVELTLTLTESDYIQVIFGAEANLVTTYIDDLVLYEVVDDTTGGGTEGEGEGEGGGTEDQAVVLPVKPTPATMPSGSKNLISPSTFEESNISDTIFTWKDGWFPNSFTKEIVTVEDTEGDTETLLKIERIEVSTNASGVEVGGNVDFYVEGLTKGKTYVLTCNAYTNNTGAAVRMGDGKNANLRTAQTLTKDAWTEVELTLNLEESDYIQVIFGAEANLVTTYIDDLVLYEVVDDSTGGDTDTDGDTDATEEVNWFKDPGVDNAETTNNQLSWGSTWNGAAFKTTITTEPDVASNGVIQITNDDSAPQGNQYFDVTGLTPNTQYTFTCKAKTDGDLSIGVTGLTGTPDQIWDATIAKNVWDEVTVSFTTGEKQTAVSICVWHKGQNITTYLDDFKLMYVPAETSDPADDPDSENWFANNWLKTTDFEEDGLSLGTGVWNSGSWNYLTFQTEIVKDTGTNGTNVAQIASTTGQGNVKILVNGLMPNTNYVLKVSGKTDNPGSASLGMAEFSGGTSVAYRDLTSDWQDFTISFTTSDTSTSAYFLVWNKAANVTSYIDNLEILYDADAVPPEIDDGYNEKFNPDDEIIAETTTVFPIINDSENSYNWELSETFTDEFNAPLDPNKWTDTPWAGRFPSYFMDENVNVVDGKLVLTSDWMGKKVEDTTGFVNGVVGEMVDGYEAAFVKTQQGTGYGYYEIKTRTAPISMTSSFWFFGATAEIDVYEQLGRAKTNHDADAFPINTHWHNGGDWANDIPTPYVYHTGYDLTDDYYVYGFEWGAEWLKFYFQGELIHAIENKVIPGQSHKQFDEYMDLRFDMETFKWNGYPDEVDFFTFTDEKTGEERFTGDFHIEYLRVWRTDDEQNQILPEGVELAKPREGYALEGTPADITADGTIDSQWDDAFVLKNFKLVNGGIEKLTSDMTAKTMWDDEYLYVLAEVIDNDIFQNPTNIHDGDCIDLYFDGGNEKDATAYDSNDLSLKLMPDGTLGTAKAGVELSYYKRDDGYDIQVKVPWNLLGVTEPTVEQVIGFDVQLNHATTQYGKREAFTCWNGESTLWQNLSTSGNLILAGDEVPEGETFTVTFNATGGTASASTLVTDINGILTSELPTATRSDYTFDGWFTAETGGTEVTADYGFTGNTTVYAQWTAVEALPAIAMPTFDFSGTVDASDYTVSKSGTVVGTTEVTGDNTSYYTVGTDALTAVINGPFANSSVEADWTKTIFTPEEGTLWTLEDAEGLQVELSTTGMNPAVANAGYNVLVVVKDADGARREFYWFIMGSGNLSYTLTNELLSSSTGANTSGELVYSGTGLDISKISSIEIYANEKQMSLQNNKTTSIDYSIHSIAPIAKEDTGTTLPAKPAAPVVPEGSKNLIFPSTFDETGISDTIYTWRAGWNPTDFTTSIAKVNDDEMLKIERTKVSTNASGANVGGNIEFWVEGLTVGKTYILECNAYTDASGASVQIGDGKNTTDRKFAALTKDAWTPVELELTLADTNGYIHVLFGASATTLDMTTYIDDIILYEVVDDSTDGEDDDDTTTGDQVNWFKDPTFDEKGIFPTWGKGWNESFFTAEIVTFAKDGDTDNKALLISKDEVTSQAGNLIFEITGLTPGEEYTFKCDAYTTGTPTIVVRYNPGTDSDSVGGTTLPMNQWTEVERTFTATGSTVNLMVTATTAASDTYLDNFELMYTPITVDIPDYNNPIEWFGQNWLNSTTFEESGLTLSKSDFHSISWGIDKFIFDIVKDDTSENGTMVAQISSDSAAGGASVELTGLHPNTDYVIKVDAKSDGIASVGATRYTSDDQVQTHTMLTTEWQTYYITFTTDEVTTKGYLSLWNRGANINTYIDNITMYCSGDAPPEIDDGYDDRYNPKDEVLDATSTLKPTINDSENSYNWTLSSTFTNEFTTDLDDDEWRGTSWYGRFPSYFVSENVFVEDGKLVVRSEFGEPQLDTEGYVVEAGEYTDGFANGYIKTVKETGYGFYEISSRTPPISMATAWWFFGATGEIDVFEQVGASKLKPGYEYKYPINTHWHNGNDWANDIVTPYAHETDYDLTLDYHTYGLEWGPDWVKFYFDGDMIHAIENIRLHEHMAMIFDMEAFLWHGYPTEDDYKWIDDDATGEAGGRWSGDFQVEYVRVWRTWDEQNTILPEGLEFEEPEVTYALQGSPADIAADGTIDPVWDSAPAMELERFVIGHAAIASSNMTFKTLWDEDYLYVLSEVEDDDVFLNTDQIHNGDNIDLYFDGGNEKQFSGYDANDINLKFLPVRWELADKKGHDDIETSYYERVGEGYDVQLKLPWSVIDVTDPKLGLTIGFDMQLNQGNTAAGVRDTVMTWFGDETLWANLSTSGNLTLVGDELPESETFTVTFDANGGSVGSSSMTTDTDGTLSSLPTPTRSGYVFKGWFTATTGGAQITTSYVFSGDTTVYAQWTADTSGGGTGGGSGGSGDSSGGSGDSSGGSGDSSGGSSSSGGGSSSSGSSSNTGSSDTTEDTTTEDTTTESETVVTKDPETTGTGTSANVTVTTTTVEGKVEAVVDEAVLDDLVSATVDSAQGENTRAEVVITVETSDDDSANTVEVTLPATSMGTMAENDSAVLTVTSDIGAITFDNNALKTITAQNSDNYKIVISQVDTSELNSKQAEIVGNSPVYDLSVNTSNGSISNFDGGFATVKLPYTLKAGENPNCIYVYYVNSMGNIEKMQTMYDAQNQMIMFNTDHFSVFTIVHELLSDIFDDVNLQAWYFDYISFAYQNNLFLGTSSSKFSPDTEMTRAMLVTTLNSYAGNPEATSSANYNDVLSTQWFGSAVDWATENNIVSGVGKGNFAPEDSVTREQLALILYNYAQEKGYTISGSKSLNGFADSDSVSSWAETAMAWAYGNGLISGVSSSRLSPESSATRAQVATILKNFIENIVL